MKYYIVSWDCNGIEYFQDITDHHPDLWAEKNLFESIKQSKKVKQPLNFDLNLLKLRAQMNSHRHYEIYIFTSDEDVGPEYIKDWFTEDPQGFANWVREYHTQKIWDDRVTKKAVIV
jgi:hypothetical protein